MTYTKVHSDNTNYLRRKYGYSGCLGLAVCCNFGVLELHVFALSAMCNI
jgi:hypothetical protein